MPYYTRINFAFTRVVGGGYLHECKCTWYTRLDTSVRSRSFVAQKWYYLYIVMVIIIFI